MPREFTACRWRVQLVVALTSLAAGCAAPRPALHVLPNPVPVLQQPVVRAPTAAPPVSVIDGNAWSPAIAAITQQVQQAALASGDVDVIRTADNRLLIRAGIEAVFERRGAVPRARFRIFINAMAETLAKHPSVFVRVVGYADAGTPRLANSNTKQPLAWAHAVLRMMSRQSIGAERLTARAHLSDSTDVSDGVAGPTPKRRIEILLADEA